MGRAIEPALVALCALMLGACTGQQADSGISISPAAAPSRSATPGSAISAAPSTTGVRNDVKVYVVGAVAKPGVYTLPIDSRVEDAVKAAGGFADGADQVRINLAARVRDEQEIFVPKIGQPATTASDPAGRLNVNTASAKQLRDSLGLSTTLSSKIVSYRDQHGPYGSVDDLKKVPVPSAQLDRIKDVISFQ